MKKLFLSLTAIFLSLTLAACSTAEKSTIGGADEVGEAAADAPSAPLGGAHADADADGYYEAGDIEYGAAFDGIADDMMSGESAAPEGVYGDYDSSDGFGENHIPAAAGTLTAGEWIDNDHLTFWNALHQIEDTGWSSYSALWSRAYTARTFVTVTSNGKPVENATVTVTSSDNKTLWTAKTDNEGKAYLFYSPSQLDGGLTVTATYGNYSAKASITSDNYTSAAIELTGEITANSKSLDLMLIVDTTGSMSDELSYLQAELESVITRAVSDNGNIPVRLSVNFYRDDGDEYVVRDFPFTENISQAISDLNAQNADGGGDMPEKVNASLDNAINHHDWNENSTKLLFIILDAPPHSEDAKAVAEMNSLTEQAAEKGIRIIPILASGGDKEAEYLMRDIAMKTGGSYLFLTDDSGVSAGGHIQPTVGDYEVEKLNDLMVKVINRYLANAQTVAEYIDEKVELIEEQEPETTTKNEQ